MSVSVGAYINTPLHINNIINQGLKTLCYLAFSFLVLLPNLNLLTKLTT